MPNSEAANFFDGGDEPAVADFSGNMDDDEDSSFKMSDSLAENLEPEAEEAFRSLDEVKKFFVNEEEMDPNRQVELLDHLEVVKIYLDQAIEAAGFTSEDEEAVNRQKFFKAIRSVVKQDDLSAEDFSQALKEIENLRSGLEELAQEAG